MRNLILCWLLLPGITVTAQRKLTDFLPEKTRTLISVHPLALANKIPGETFRQSFFYREMMKEPEAPPAKIFLDPASAGIDLSNIFIVMSEGSSPTLNVTHLMAKLSSRQKLEAMLFSTGLPGGEVKVYGTDCVFNMGEKGVLAWNNDIVIFANRSGYDESEPEAMFHTDTVTVYADDMPRQDQDSLDRALEKWMEEQKKYHEKVMRNLAFDLLTPRPANRLATDARLISLLASGGDILVWNDDKYSTAFSRVMPVHGLLGRLGSLVSGERAVAINFQGGKITAHTTEYHSPEIRAILEEHPHQPAGDDMIRQLPEGNLLALMNASYNDAFFRQLLGRDAMKELADSVRKFTNIDITTLGNVFGKKMMMAVVEKPGAKPRVDLVLAMPIADLAAFNKIKSGLLPLYDSLRRSDSDFLKKMNPVIRHNDRMMVLSLSAATADNYMSDQKMQAPPTWVKDYTGYPMMMDVDLKAIVKLVTDNAGSEKMGEVGLKFLNQLDRIRIFGGQFQNGATTTTAEFRFSDPSKNALQQIFEMMGTFFEKMEKAGENGEETEGHDQ